MAQASPVKFSHVLEDGRGGVFMAVLTMRSGRRFHRMRHPGSVEDRV